MESTKELFVELVGLLFGQTHHSIDELLLEKLLNQLERENSELLEEIDLSRIIDTLLAKDDVDQRIKSFGLRLIGLKVSTIRKMSDLDFQSITKLLFQQVKMIQTPFCPAGIKNSSLKMLRNFVHKDELKNLIAKTGILTLATNLLSDNSMFVQHEAQLFLSDFLLKYLISNDEIAAELLDHILRTFDKRGKMHFTHSMMVLKRLCESNSHENIEMRLLESLWDEDEEFICNKVCQVLAVIHTKSKNYTKVDEILRRLTTLDYIPISVKYCCDLLTNNLPPNLTAKLQSYLLLVMDSMTKTDKTSNYFTSLFTTMLKLDFSSLSEDFRISYVRWFCNFVSEEQTEQPKLILSVMDKFMIIYNHSNSDSRALIKNTITDLINLRMVSDAVLMKTLCVYGKLNFDDLVQIEKSVNYLLYHPNWAVQDSVLELIGRIVSGGQRDSLDTLLANRLHLSVWEKLNMENNESFTRATALITLSEMTRVDILWENLIQSVDEQKIVNQILIYLLTDCEVIVRRAATRAVTTLYLNDKKMSSKRRRQILSTMQTVVSDSDWEVKHGALEFWRRIVQQVGKDDDDLSEFIAKLDNLGFAFALLSTIDDCDPTVRCEAACILSEIQAKLKTSDVNVQIASEICVNEDDFVALDTCEPVDDNVMEAVLNICDSDVMNNRIVKVDSEKSVSMDCEKSVVLFGADKFVNSLLSLDLEKIGKGAKVNADIYEENLQLLVVDLIAMIKKTENCDVILDCY